MNSPSPPPHVDTNRKKVLAKYKKIGNKGLTKESRSPLDSFFSFFSFPWHIFSFSVYFLGFKILCSLQQSGAGTGTGALGLWGAAAATRCGLLVDRLLSKSAGGILCPRQPTELPQGGASPFGRCAPVKKKGRADGSSVDLQRAGCWRALGAGLGPFSFFFLSGATTPNITCRMAKFRLRPISFFLFIASGRKAGVYWPRRHFGCGMTTTGYNARQRAPRTFRTQQEQNCPKRASISIRRFTDDGRLWRVRSHAARRVLV